MRNLPGSSHSVPENTKCDIHAERHAVANIQGETDSFGAEYILMCQECYNEYKEETKNPHISDCDWCEAKQTATWPRRDYEEGMSGRVYYLCQTCIDRDNAKISNELNDRDFYCDYGDWD